MSVATEADDAMEASHPRETGVLFGHSDAEQTLLDAYRSGHVPHAWLIGGERGIGKATLAYRMARFVLAHPDPTTQDVQSSKSLNVPPEHPVARRIAGQAHSDLLVLERTLNDKGKLRQDIAVDDVRRAVPFFGSTAGEGGWRVAIVDAVDELNAAGANALLKVVEEPPTRALLLLVCHAPGRALATIRSRCRRLALRPLEPDDIAQAVSKALGKNAGAAEIRAAALAADGSVERALMFLSGSALELRRQVTTLLDQLPKIDQRALHALGDSLSGTEPATFAAFMDTINAWLGTRIASGTRTIGNMAPVAQAWEQINRSAREVDVFNLDRKPFVFAVFGTLAEAARGPV